jgi:hypothetical protein
MSTVQPSYTANSYTPAAQPSLSVKPAKKMAFKISPSVILGTIIILLVIALTILGFNYYNLSLQSQDNRSDEVLAEIKKLVRVGEDENVNVALIEDAEELRKQNAGFYANAKKGDFLVVFTTSQRVLIYDRAISQIVNFSSYNIIPELIAEDKINDAEKPLNVEIRVAANGSRESAASLKENLENLSPNYKVTATTATVRDYKALTVVIQNKSKKPSMSQNLQNQVTASPGNKTLLESLPEGENPSNADVVIIIGG